MRRFLGGVIVVMLGFGLAACGDDDDDSPAVESEGGGGDGVAVTTSGLAFDPTEISVTAGEVTFDITNEDDAPHTFTVDDASLKIEVDSGGSASGSATFEAGEYDFRCEIHPAMTGTITAS